MNCTRLGDAKTGWGYEGEFISDWIEEELLRDFRGREDDYDRYVRPGLFTVGYLMISAFPQCVRKLTQRVILAVPWFPMGAHGGSGILSDAVSIAPSRLVIIDSFCCPEVSLMPRPLVSLILCT